MKPGWYKTSTESSARAHWYTRRGAFVVARCSPTVDRSPDRLDSQSLIPRCLLCLKLTRI